jgi:putative NADH-flavin reductase
MKLVVFGATGGTGSQIVERALAAGHDVVAVVRSPNKVKARDRLRVDKGDITDATTFTSSLAGADAVLCAIGPSDNRKPGTVISSGAKNVVDACTQSGVKRLVFESGLMVGDGSELSFLGRTAIKFFGGVYSALRTDKARAEETIANSTLAWTIVRPPNLSYEPAKGGYVVGPRARVTAWKALPHADVADYMIDAAINGRDERAIVNIGFA